MASKKEILKKIRILITQKFKTPKEAFEFFDKDGDGYLKKKELIKLIKDAKVNSWISGIVADQMITGLDNDKNKKFDWKEFKAATEKLIKDA